jgi:hypothetical protein
LPQAVWLRCWVLQANADGRRRAGRDRGIVLLRRTRWQQAEAPRRRTNPDVNSRYRSDLEVPAPGTIPVARACLPRRGLDVELAPGAEPKPGRYRIVEVRGALIVARTTRPDFFRITPVVNPFEGSRTCLPIS